APAFDHRADGPARRAGARRDPRGRQPRRTAGARRHLCAAVAAPVRRFPRRAGTRPAPTRRPRSVALFFVALRGCGQKTNLNHQGTKAPRRNSHPANAGVHRADVPSAITMDSGFHRTGTFFSVLLGVLAPWWFKFFPIPPRLQVFSPITPSL